MKKFSFDKFNVMGLSCILLGLLINPWTLHPFIPPDSLIDTAANGVFLGVFEVALIALGVAFIKYRQEVLANLLPLSMSLMIFGGSFLAMDMVLGYMDILADLDDGAHIHNVYEPDDYLGWKPIANSLGTHQTSQFNVQYQIDERGFKAVDKVGQTRYNLYFFGDSYTFGHGVTNADTYPNIMAKNYISDDIHIHNAAVMGYGIVQTYARFLEIAPQIKAGDLVVFVPLSRDIERNTKDFMFTIQFIFSEGFVKVARYPYYDQGDIKTLTLDTYYNEAKALLFSARYSGRNFQFIYNNLFKADTTQESWEMLEQARRITEAKGARFQLFFLPRTTEVRRGQYEFDLSRFQYQDIMAYFPSNRAELKQIGFEGDSHWNPAGHQMAAAAIVDKWVERGVLSDNDLKYRPVSLPALSLGELALLRVGKKMVGQQLDLMVSWEAQQAISHDYTVFVQLLNEKRERVSGVDDHPSRSMLTLAPHERLITLHHLTLPDMSNNYRLLIGLYFFEGEKLVNVGAVDLPLND